MIYKYINGMTTVEYLEQAKLNIQVTLLISSVRVINFVESDPFRLWHSILLNKRLN